MIQIKANTGTLDSQFERAIQTHPDSIMLWRMYLRCHQELGLFYRAIDKIPFCKSLWMDSWRLYKMTLDQAKDIVDLMNEKEICLITSVEDFLVEF
jgi:hypothetical protein